MNVVFGTMLANCFRWDDERQNYVQEAIQESANPPANLFCCMQIKSGQVVLNSETRLDCCQVCHPMSEVLCFVYRNFLSSVFTRM